MTIETPGNTPPELSCTTPMIFPALVCPCPAAGSRSIRTRASGSREANEDLIRVMVCLTRVRLARSPAGVRAGRCRARRHELRPGWTIGKRLRGQVDQPRNLLDLRIVDPIPGVVGGVVVRVLTGVEQHHRHALDR